MVSGTVRSVLLRLGRSTVDSTLAASGLTEPGLAEDAREVYGRLAHRVPWPDQLANRFHLVFNVLPVAALYTALRERGWTAQDAVDVVQAARAASSGLERRVWSLWLGTGPGRRLFMRVVGPNLLGMFPQPRWSGSWVERSKSRVAFNMTRCYALDTFRDLDAAPAARVMCASEQTLADASPLVRFSREGTLAAGADQCDFCYELLDSHKRARASA